MPITLNVYYTGQNEKAIAFANEMLTSGIVDRIRAEEGNLKYEYFLQITDPNTVLLVDSWESQQALDKHHASPMMQEIIALREKYDLHMRVERFTNNNESTTLNDEKFIRK